MTSKLAEPAQPHQHRRVTHRIYSIGYEGMPLPVLIDHLNSAGVTRLVDVRLNPVSRIKGYSRKALATALGEAGIDYVHERQLGNPQENRDNFRRGDGNEGRRRMREMLDNGSGPALRRLIDHAQRERVAVLCVEREENRCHRQVITDMVKELDPTIKVVQIL